MSENRIIHSEGDEDIKIAVPSSKKNSDSKAEKEEILEQLKTADDTGRLDMAKKLGIDSAEKIMRCEQEFPDIPDESGHLIFNCRLLLLFAVTVACERYMPNTILARTVINSCHDRMVEICPELFSGEGDYSTAMSFYYLAVRGMGNVEDEIGKTFAMICGNASDPQLKKLGTVLFERCMEIIENQSAPFNTAQK